MSLLLQPVLDIAELFNVVQTAFLSASKFTVGKMALVSIEGYRHPKQGKLDRRTPPVRIGDMPFTDISRPAERVCGVIRE